jgi:hypothetical protein
MLENDFDDNDERDALIDGLPGAKKTRSVDTMFKSTYRVHVNLSNIADNKANIMISINALMVSIVFSSLITASQPHPGLWLPFGWLLASALSSIVFAALSAMPRVRTTPLTVEEVLSGEKGLLFFGNYTQLSPEDFFRAVNGLMEDKALVYKNMSIDLYVMGIVLKRKYKLLRVSYLSFMAGLIGSAVLFLISWLISK